MATGASTKNGNGRLHNDEPFIRMVSIPVKGEVKASAPPTDEPFHDPDPTPEELELADFTDRVKSTVEGLSTLIAFEEMPDPAELLMRVGNDQLYRDGRDREARNRLGYVLMLDAMLAAPEQVMLALQFARDRLVELDPNLAVLDHEPTRRRAKIEILKEVEARINARRAAVDDAAA